MLSITVFYLMKTITWRLKKSKRYVVWINLIFVLYSSAIHAEIDWVAVSLDNDIFVGTDEGYTNGLFASWYKIAATQSNQQPSQQQFLQPGWLVKLLQWSLGDQQAAITVNSYTLGQVMVTPEDITAENPDPDDVPYGGLLFLSSTHMTVHDRYTDKISSTIGIVGPASGAGRAQTFIHKATGSAEPKGWEHQLDNEIVFKLGRSKLYRGWVSKNQQRDVLTYWDVGVGTLESSIGTGLIYRFGRAMEQSYPTVLSSKISNAMAINRGYYGFIGLGAKYTFNQIFVDGNTFKDGPSVDAEPFRINGVIGFAYSWDQLSITVAIQDVSLGESVFNNDDVFGDQFGTLTLAWKTD